MNVIEAQDFFDNIVKEMWPHWEPTDWQRTKWMSTFAICDFYQSKRKLEQWYSDSERPGREPTLGIFNKIKVLDPNCDIHRPEPILWFELAPQHDLTARDGFYSMTDPGKETIERMADWFRERANEIHGFDWVVIRTWEQKKPPMDDAILDAEGRIKIADEILAGPDCPGRRFLRRYRKLDVDGLGGLLKNVNAAVCVNIPNRRQEMQKALDLPAKPQDDIPF